MSLALAIRPQDAAYAAIERRAWLREQKQAAEEDFMAFVRFIWPVIEPETPLVEGWLLDLLADVLMAISDGHQKRVCINVPPGSMKSSLLNVLWPAWEWGPCNRPFTRYLSISYSTAVPIRDNLRFAQVIKHPLYQRCWGDRVKLTRDGAEWVGNTMTGWKAVTSVGGSTTGMRGDRILCLPYEAQLLTPSGYVAIGDYITGGLSLPVLAFDEAIQLTCWGRVVSRQINPARPLMEVTTQSGHTLVATEDHRIYTSSGLKRMDELRPGDVLGVVDDGMLVSADVPGWQRIHRGDASGSSPPIQAASLGLQSAQRWHRAECRFTSGKAGGDQEGGFGSSASWALPQVTGNGCYQGVSNLQATWIEFNDRRQWSQRPDRRVRETSPPEDERRQGKTRGHRALEKVSSVGVDAREEGCPSGDDPREVEGSRISGNDDGRSTTQRRVSGEHPSGKVGRSYPARSVFPEYVSQDVSEMGRPSVPGKGPQGKVATPTTIISVRPLSRTVNQTYNIEIAVHHNYFAGGVLLRNCDDLNNPMDVESEVVRNTTNRFVREIMPDRLNSLTESAIINLQQRTHEQDATGTLIEFGRGYQFLCVPMEFDPLRIGRFVVRYDDDGNEEDVWTDPRALDEDGNQLAGLTVNERGEPMVRMGSPMAHAEGTSCWPERFSEDAIRALKFEKAAYAWDAQYQQIPGVRGGAIIKKEWWKLWTGDYPPLGTVIASLDTAVEEGEANDWNALTVWGAFAGEEGEPLLLLLAGWKIRCSLAELASRVSQTCRERKVDYLLVEHKTRGRDVHDEIVRLYQNSQWQTLLLKVNGDKTSRLRAVEHLFSGDVREDPITKLQVAQGGIVYAPDRDWSDEIIAQVAAFPYAAHDDYTDSVSQALGFVRKNGVVLRRVEYDEQELERNKFRKTLKVPYAIGDR